MKFAYKKGLLARDSITKFTGIITWRVDYITGCAQYGLQPEVDSEGKVSEAHQYDEQRIEILGRGILTEKEYEAWLKKKKVEPATPKDNPGGPGKSVGEAIH